MGTGITIDISGLSKVKSKLEELKTIDRKKFKSVLDKNGLKIVNLAKTKAPVDQGALRNSISYKIVGNNLEIIAGVTYAAYIEFGTKKYAAEEVAKLPTDWQQYAAQFKGGKSGDYYDFLNAILDWVKRKGLSKVINSYTGKEVRGKAAKENLLVLAEYIAWNILKNGIKAQPYLRPAVEDVLPKLEEDIIKLFSK